MRNYTLIFCLIIFSLDTLLWAKQDSPVDFHQLLQQTELQVAQAQTVNGLWRDTQQLVKQAKELFNAGKQQEAIALLHEAQSQAQLGYQQAIDQADKELVPSYLRQ